MLRWLSQVTTLGLQRDHVYRSRWLVQNPFQFAVACSSIPTGPISQAFLNMPGTGTAFPADLVVFTTEIGLPSDWPADRRDVLTKSPNECVVWAQMRAASSFLLPVGNLEQTLAPVNGRLVDFWDETDDIVLVGEAAPPVPPSAPPPTTTPPPPTIPPPTTTPPAPPPTTAPKSKKKPSQVIIPWAIVIGGASLLIKVLRG